MKNKNNKLNLAIYIILRFIVILVLVREVFINEWANVFLCILTLVSFTIPAILDKRLNIKLPNALEYSILLFIFSSAILGEIVNFYGVFKFWDSLLHIVNGFLCAAIGFSLVDILNRNKRFLFKMTPIFVSLVAFCFSMTIGILWEFFEFGADNIFKTDMQKDTVVSSISSVYLEPSGKNIPIIIDNISHTVIYNTDKDGNVYETTIEGGYLDIGLIDTMKDLMVNFIGALIFTSFGYLYIRNRKEYNFAEKFIPTLKTKSD